MKKIALSLLIATMTISLSACGQTVSNTDNSEEIAELKEEIESLKEENAELKAKLDTTDTSSPKQSDEDSSELDNFVVETSGVCGADLTWEYGNGILRIHGTGDMSDYEWTGSSHNYPWIEIYDKIGHVYIEDGCTHIGNNAFTPHNESIISHVSIPDTVRSIGSGAFDRNHNLQSVDLPYGLEHIGGSAFSSCSKLTNIEIPDTVTFIGYLSFSGTEIESVTIPDNIIAFGQNAFSSDVQITWRGNTYIGCHPDDELINKMKETGIEILND